MIDSIQFPFDFDKTAQASALFLDLFNRDLNWRYLTGLLYLADKEHLLRSGYPITGDVYVCVGTRPNLLNTNELIHHQPINDMMYPEKFWQKYFTQPDNEGKISLIKHPGNTELTRLNEEVIEGLFRTYANKSLAELEAWISSFAECEDRGYPRFIKVYDLLAKHGYVLEDLIEVKNAAEREKYFSKINSN